jgi:hypothetical protein
MEINGHAKLKIIFIMNTSHRHIGRYFEFL